MADNLEETRRVDAFLLALEKFAGATIWQGVPAFVAEGTCNFSPCMYDEALFQKAIDSGRAEKRVLIINDRFVQHRIEIISVKK
jgi:hypothetical protein